MTAKELITSLSEGGWFPNTVRSYTGEIDAITRSEGARALPHGALAKLAEMARCLEQSASTIDAQLPALSEPETGAPLAQACERIVQASGAVATSARAEGLAVDPPQAATATEAELRLAALLDWLAELGRQAERIQEAAGSLQVAAQPEWVRLLVDAWDEFEAVYAEWGARVGEEDQHSQCAELVLGLQADSGVDDISAAGQSFVDDCERILSTTRKYAAKLLAGGNVIDSWEAVRLADAMRLPAGTIASALVLALTGAPGESELRERVTDVDSRFSELAGKFARRAKSARQRRAEQEKQDSARAYLEKVRQAATQRTPVEEIASFLGPLRVSVHRVTSSRALSLVDDDHAGNPAKIVAGRVWNTLLGTIDEERECLASRERGRGLAGRVQTMLAHIADAVHEGLLATITLIESRYPRGWGYSTAAARDYIGSCRGVVSAFEELLGKIGKLDAARNQRFRAARSDWERRLNDWSAKLEELDRYIAASAEFSWGKLADDNCSLLQRAKDGAHLLIEIHVGPPVVAKLLESDERSELGSVPVAVVRKNRGKAAALRSVFTAVLDGHRTRGRVEIHGVDDSLRISIKKLLVHQTGGTFEIRFSDDALPAAA